MDKAEHIEWMYREACVRLHKQQVTDLAPTKGPWFQLANLIEDLFPDEVKDYRKRMGVDDPSPPSDPSRLP